MHGLTIRAENTEIQLPANETDFKPAGATAAAALTAHPALFNTRS
jgi:hypothetical protein